jgi:hypothetical protein
MTSFFVESSFKGLPKVEETSVHCIYMDEEQKSVQGLPAHK